MSTPTTPTADGPDQRATDRSLSRDEAFHLLQNARRRDVLRYLSRQSSDAVCEIKDVAAQVAAWENDTPVDQLSSDERQRVYIALYQSHLPKLDEAGVVDYDQSRGRLEPTPALEQLYAYLAIGAEEKPPEREATGRRRSRRCDTTVGRRS
ncbi:hypothetical protein SAMN04487948_107104 [Halogranum amylolyticum]|uniref:DUF7344 domain-containing protein n=1 Tax=Halogranum amylolyticum TaxID=660520 RepID=A0A1H8TJ64_9EURY|nr:hypothetical protein [Halogranum amylolyticum]SEO91012.1 hypothetical protein SAMN04487948_107104 [Halogranum amylolyticum]